MNDKVDEIAIKDQAEKPLFLIKLDEAEAAVLNQIKAIFDNKKQKSYEDISKLLIEWSKALQTLQNSGLAFLNRCHGKQEHSKPIINWLTKTHSYCDKNFDHLINIHEKLDKRDLTDDGLIMGANSDDLALHCEKLLDEVFFTPEEP